MDPIAELTTYVSAASVSTDPQYAWGMQQARNFLTRLLGSIGFKVDEISTPCHPIILASRGGDPAWPHVIIYGHYDVQPADPFELWQTPPFEPHICNGRMFGRGTADNKGPLITHIAAVAQLLKAHPDLPLRITFMIEGEEEMGSPSFSGFIHQYCERLRGDFVLLSDTKSPSSEQLGITIGLRGLVALEVVAQGPASDLHSGLHGGAVMNPIRALAQLLSTLHTAQGLVNIPGFYDDVGQPQAWERAQIYNIPQSVEDYRKSLNIPAFGVEDGYTPFEAIALRPTLEYNGISGGYQGPGSKTIIPSKASAKITARLVPNQKADRIAALIQRTLQERCPAGVRLTVTCSGEGDPYGVIPPGIPNSPSNASCVLIRAFQAAEKAIVQSFGKPPLYLREGGSIPIISELKAVTGMDSLMIGLFTAESHLHAPNENFDLALMQRAIPVSAEILKSIAITH